MRTAFFRWRGGDADYRSQWQKKRDERGAAVKISSVRRKAAQKFGAPQQGHRPLWRVYKRCDWTWHTVYTYITHIHPQNPRKVCRPQAAKNSNHFSLRHVCGGKIPLRQPIWNSVACGKIMRAADRKPLWQKILREFLPVKKETPGGVSFCCKYVDRLYLICQPGPCWPQPFPGRYRRASWTPQP